MGNNVAPLGLTRHGRRGRVPSGRGLVLAHETFHLYQTQVLGLRFNTPTSCLRRELEAFGASVDYCGQVFPNGKPNPANQVEVDLNALLGIRGTAAADAALARIISGYIEPGGECSPS